MQSELLTPSNERMLQGWKNKGFNEYHHMTAYLYSCLYMGMGVGPQ